MQRTFNRPSYMPKYWPVSSDCVLYLEGQQDPQSSTIRDLSGNNNHGTITGATWTRLSSGLGGLSFNGANNRIDCGDDSSLHPITDLTVMIWLKAAALDAASYPRLIDCLANDGGTYKGYGIYQSINSYDIRCEIGGNGGLKQIAIATATQNVWGHAAFTYVSGTGFIRYWNGSSIGGPSDDIGNILYKAAEDNLLIGKSYLGSGFEGYLALGKVFDVALSGAQIDGIYQQERHLFGV